MSYKIGQGRSCQGWGVFIGKLILVIIGGLIGASLGLYVAARTLPVPHTTVVNVYHIN